MVVSSHSHEYVRGSVNKVGLSYLSSHGIQLNTYLSLKILWYDLVFVFRRRWGGGIDYVM